jgi:hypothetical protein
MATRVTESANAVQQPISSRRTGQFNQAEGAPGVVRAIPERAASRQGRVRIERLILHGLDHRNSRLDLVDEPALFTDAIEAFFTTHIEAASSRSDWRARFRDPTAEIPALCRTLLQGPGEFVAASQELARRLYDQMRPRTIAPGDLVVIIYTHGEDALRHVALLKLDPDQRLVRNFSVSGGRTRVTISAAGNLLPDSARLQKCALLTLATPTADFDVHLLDTQAGPRADGVAAFFYRAFLGAELLPSPRRQTREFLRQCDGWLAAHCDVLTPAALAAFYHARRTALGADLLDPANFATAALPAHPELAAQLAAALTGLTEAAPSLDAPPLHRITVDPAVAAPVVNRVVLELDGGARLVVPAERFAELVRIDPARTAENKVRLVIESLTLKEVTER